VAVGPPEPGSRRYRLTVWQAVWHGAPGLAGPLLASLGDGGAPDTWHETLGLTIAALAVGLLVAAARWFGVTLRPDAAVVHGFSRPTILWSSVMAIQVERRFGQRAVVLHHYSGSTRLRAPVDGPFIRDRHFDRKVGEIGRWWEQHRGPAWRPLRPLTPPEGYDPANPFAPPASR